MQHLKLFIPMLLAIAFVVWFTMWFGERSHARFQAYYGSEQYYQDKELCLQRVRAYEEAGLR